MLRTVILESNDFSRISYRSNESDPGLGQDDAWTLPGSRSLIGLDSGLPRDCGGSGGRYDTKRVSPDLVIFFASGLPADGFCEVTYLSYLLFWGTRRRAG